MRNFFALVLIGLSLLFRPSAPAEVVVISDFTGIAPGMNTPWTLTSALNPNVEFYGWVRGAGAFGSDTVTNAFGFFVSAIVTQASTLAEAIADNEYIACTLAPKPGYTLNLNGAEMVFGIRRYSSGSPRRYAVFTSVGGFAAGQEIFTTPSFAAGNNTNVVFRFYFPLTGYNNLTGPVEIRIVAFEAYNWGNRTSLTSFELHTGDVVYPLTLNAGSGGTVQVDPPGTLFREGQTVKVSATPQPGFHFAGWSGDVVGLGNPRYVTMDGPKTITAHFAPNPPPQMHVGINLDALADWSTAYVFVDAFKEARPWQTRNVDGSGAWGSGFGHLVPVDENGWPTVVPFDPGNGNPLQIVHTIVNLNEAGTYTFLYEGSGVLRFRWPGAGFTNLPTGGARSFTFQVTNSQATTYIEIHATDPNDHLRNFRIITPGHLSTYQTQPFHPLYLQRLQPFAVLRFMDWARINNSTLATWSQRTKPTTYTQARAEGVALEYMVELCNTLQKHMWLCIPAMANDDFVRQTARLVRDSLDPELLIFLEYSNETWNSIFSQYSYVNNQGLALGLDSNAWTAGNKYTARRSAEIWRIFEEEFGSSAPNRLVKVLAGQAANTAVAQTRINAINDPTVNPLGVLPDALAIAPYFGKTYRPSDIPPQAPAYPTVDEIVTVVSSQAIASAQTYIINHKNVADAQGWALICYEGGQHFVGGAGAENDTTLTSILISANRDPRMYDRYIEYMDMMKANGIELFPHFSYCGHFRKSGSWGSLEYQDQPLAEAPKYRALVDWIATNFDVEPPAITCPPNVTVNNQLGACSASVNPGTALASDNSGTATVTGQRSDGQPLTSPYPVGTTLITWTAADPAGNTSSCVQTVSVVDAQAPAISCPGNIVTNAPAGQNSLSLNPGTASATDNCSSVTVTASRSDGQSFDAPFPLGTNTITWIATDSQDNVASCLQTIIVGPGADTTPPSAPTNLRTTAQTTSTISLAWNASTDNVGVVRYRVYRNNVHVGNPTGTTYTDTGLTANTQYSYYVRAEDAAGNLSAASNTLNVRTKRR